MAVCDVLFQCTNEIVEISKRMFLVMDKNVGLCLYLSETFLLSKQKVCDQKLTHLKVH